MAAHAEPLHAEQEPVHAAAERHAGPQRAGPRRAAQGQPSDALLALTDAAFHYEAVPPGALDCGWVPAEADAQQVRCGSVQADLREPPGYGAFHVELPQGYAASHAETAQERCCALPAGSPGAAQQRCSPAQADAERYYWDARWSHSDERFRWNAECWLRAHWDAERCSHAAALPECLPAGFWPLQRQEHETVQASE
jgi:hypothetical protein